MSSDMETDNKKKIGRGNLLTGNWGEQYISERLSSCVKGSSLPLTLSH